MSIRLLEQYLNLEQYWNRELHFMILHRQQRQKKVELSLAGSATYAFFGYSYYSITSRCTHLLFLIFLTHLLFFLEFFLDSRLAVPYFNEKNKYPKRTHFRIIKEVDLAVQTSRTTLSLLPQSQTFLALITILVITLKYKDCFLLVEMSIPFFNSDF